MSAVLAIASVIERGDGGDRARPPGRDAGQDLDPETDAGDTDHAPDLTRTLAENTRTGMRSRTEHSHSR